MAFFIKTRVYMEDTDAGGIVYHANYLRYFERARSDWVRELIDQRHFMERGQQILVIKSINIEYKKPAKLGDLLKVTAEPIEVRRSCIRFKQRITHYTDGTDLDSTPELCSAEVLVVTVDQKTMKLSKIPQPLFDQCLNLLNKRV